MSKSKFKFLSKSEELFNYVSKILKNIPKKDRFLKDKIEECQYNIIKHICSYNIYNNINMKRFYLISVIEEYALYDYLINKLVENKFITDKQYIIIGRSIEEVLRIAKGLMKSNNKEVNNGL